MSYVFLAEGCLIDKKQKNGGFLCLPVLSIGEIVLTLQQFNMYMSKEVKDTEALVRAIVQGIQEKKGHSIVVVNMENIITAPSRYFVICQGGSPQQVSAIAGSVEDMARELEGEKPAAVVGRENAEWVALDYGTVMVHVFLPEAREHYDLEHLWDDATLTEVPDLD